MSYFTISGERIELSRGKIKNFYLRVYPDGRACARVPMRATNAQIEAFLRARIPWLRETRAKLASRDRAASPFQDGGTLWLFGEAYTVRISHEGKPGLRFSQGEAVLNCPESADMDARRQIALKAYGAYLSPYIAERLAYFAPRMGVRYTAFSLRFMTSRWGSCTLATGRMRFNIRLAQKPKEWIDSVVVHELAHLRHADHSAAFWALVEAHAPDARKIGREMGKGVMEAL